VAVPCHDLQYLRSVDASAVTNQRCIRGDVAVSQVPVRIHAEDEIRDAGASQPGEVASESLLETAAGHLTYRGSDVTPTRYLPALMPPVASVDERCPCGSERDFTDCCASGRRAVARLTPEVLAVWARERGVEEHLRVSLGAVAGGKVVLRSAAMRWMRSGLTVGDVLAPSVYVSQLVNGPLLDARSAAWAFLVEEARSVREALDEEARPRGLPTHPTLAVVAQSLLELRAEVRRWAKPRPVQRLEHCSVRVDAEARRFSFVEHRKVQVARTGSVVEPAVVLPLARVREEPLTVPACSCGARRPCAHALAAVDLALAQLADPRRPASWDGLARALDEPSWSRVLSTLHDLDIARRRTRAEGESVRCSFRLRAVGRGVLEVVPYQHKRRRDGDFGQGQRIRTRDLARVDRFPPEDRAALGRFGRLDYGYGYHVGYHGERPTDLLALAGHPRVFFEGDDESPFTVSGVELGLAILPHEEGGLELLPRAADVPIPADELRAELAELGPDGAFLRVDRERRALLVVKVANPDAARTVVVALAEHGQRFPPEAESALLERLGALRSVLPIVVPDGLEGKEVAPARRQVLRLALRNAGLEVAALARPLDGAPPQPPGDGPPRLVASTPEGRVFASRELEAERVAARELLASVSLGEPEGNETYRRVVEDDERALGLLERLRTLGRPDVTVEWVGAPPRVVRASRARELRVEVRDRADWFGLDGEVELEGERVKLAVLLEALRERRTVVRVEGGAWVAIAAELAERLSPLAHISRPTHDGVEIGPGALGALDDLARDGAKLTAHGAFAQLRARMRAASKRTPAVPRSFAGKLRDYQVEGFRWLARLASWGAGAVLADDMGLGKTLQALALLCDRAKEGPALVVAPTSVCANWVAEARRFAPKLNVTLFRESDRAGAVAALGPGDVLVASYGLLVLELERFRGKQFATLVLDEAQAVKNASTRRARAAREVDAAFRVALSGTPVENHLGELWSLYRIAFPGLLGSWETFRRRFAVPIERDRDPDRGRALVATLRPFLLRRTKAEVARELPRRTEITVPVALSTAERRLYEQVRLAAMARLAGLGEAARPEHTRFQVLAAITELRLLACHPRLHEAECAVPSSKLVRFLELAAELAEGGHRALVFSQFTSHLALVREALTAAGRSFLYLDGRTAPAERDRLVERFQAGDGELFLISLKAGGTGLNLTAADYVVHLDPWWNPAVEDQATDRAHRIGQRRPVTVYRLLSQGTIEEAIVTLHAKKRDLVAGVLGGMDAAGRLSPEDLMALIRLAPQEGEGREVSGGSSGDAGVVLEVEAEAGEADPAGSRAEEEDAEPDLSARGTREGPGPGIAVHDAVLERFRNHLRQEHARGRFVSGGPVKSYPRAVQRFFAYLAAERIPVTSLRSEISELASTYLEALRTGRFPAPDSEPILARSAMGELTRFLSA
jgi:superfamily II DNA or RNA helicase